MTRDQFEAHLCQEFGEAFVISYFERSQFAEGDNPIIYPWSIVASDVFKRRARHFLEREGVKLGPAVCEHLKSVGRAAR